MFPEAVAHHLAQKPLAHYRRTVGITRKLLDGMTGLRKIRENIPRKETVSNVFNERRDFVSTQHTVGAHALTVSRRSHA